MSIINEPYPRRVTYDPTYRCETCGFMANRYYLRDHVRDHAPDLRTVVFSCHSIRVDQDTFIGCVVTDLINAAPKHALSADVYVLQVEQDRPHRPAHTCSFSVTYYTTASEGFIKLPRPGTCRECGEAHLQQHDALCSLRGDDRFIYVGKENLT